MGTATRPDCTDLHVVTAPPEKVLDLQSRDPRSCPSSVSGNKRCPITPPPTLVINAVHKYFEFYTLITMTSLQPTQAQGL